MKEEEEEEEVKEEEVVVVAVCLDHQVLWVRIGIKILF